MTNDPNISAALDCFDNEFGELNSVFGVDSKQRVRNFLEQELLTLAEKERQAGREEVIKIAEQIKDNFLPVSSTDHWKMGRYMQIKEFIEEARHPKTI